MSAQEALAGNRCGLKYDQHPTKPYLIAVCVLPPEHEGPHDNGLSKRDEEA